MKQRTPYRPDQGQALARIEASRSRLKITQEDLAEAADLSIRTYRRMIKSGLGFQRQIRALRFALRTIEAKRRSAEKMFEGHDG
ncbi:hypothetical protein ACIQUB_07185 [Rhizobium sp. NPDC090275]|uniref:hypothetical protein n=1 Tax=Rhizobium sp. NPDC090275 TaxID=3364498 RepID=UPI00383A288B